MTNVTELNVWRGREETEGRDAKRGEQAAPEIVTYHVNAEWARAELDHADMVALSGMFRRWAIYETGDWVTPSRRTGLIKWSADLERIAEWVGEGWKASEPSEEPSLIKHMACCERQTSSVVDLGEMIDFEKLPP